MPQPAHPYFDWPYPIAFAHRGGALEVPENTMVAFEHAIDLGFRYIETDVQVTRDGVLVIFHDFDLLRTCGIDRKLSEMTWAEVSAARVNGVAPIPRLDELLGTWPDVRVNIDCETDSAVPALVSVLRRTNSLDRVCVGAFNDLRIRRIRSIVGPDLCTSLAPAAVLWLRLGRSFVAPTRAAQVPVRQGPLTVVTPKFIDRAHRGGMPVHVWTIDDPTEMRRLLDLGVDGLMTDRPTVLREVLHERGQWVA